MSTYQVQYLTVKSYDVEANSVEEAMEKAGDKLEWDEASWKPSIRVFEVSSDGETTVVGEDEGWKLWMGSKDD